MPNYISLFSEAKLLANNDRSEISLDTVSQPWLWDMLSLLCNLNMKLPVIAWLASITRLESWFLMTRTQLESGWKNGDSTRVTLFTEWLDSTHSQWLESESFLHNLWVPDGQTQFVCTQRNRPDILVGMGQTTTKPQYLNIYTPLFFYHHPQNVPFSGASFSE